MAIICPYPERKGCRGCSHLRFDEDRGENACWLAEDLKKDKKEQEKHLLFLAQTLEKKEER